MDFNQLNEKLYQQSMPSRYPKKKKKKKSDYDKGYIKIANWLAELCLHFEKRRAERDSMDEIEFNNIVEEYRVKIEELEDSSYKKGLMKALGEVL